MTVPPPRRRLALHPTLLTIGGVGGAAAISQVATLAVSPILARLYPAEAFGGFGALLAFANIASTIMLFGLSDAILAAHVRKDADALFAAALRIGGLLLVPVAAVAWLAIGRDWFGLGILPALAIVPIVVLTAILALSSLMQALMVNAQAFRPMAQSYVGLGLARAAVQVAGGALRAAYGGLAAGEIAGRLAAILLMANKRGGELAAAARMDAGAIAATLSAYRHFPLQRTPSAVLGAMTIGSPILMVAHFYGAAPAGQYNLTFTAVMGPLALIQRAVGDVFTGQFGALMRTDRRAAVRYLLTIASALAGLGLAAALFLRFLGEPAFTVLFGARWAVAGQMASIAALWVGAMIAVVPVSQALIVTHRPGFKFAFDIAYAAMLAALYWSLSHWPVGPIGFVERLALVGVTANLILIPLIAAAVSRPGAMLRAK